MLRSRKSVVLTGMIGFGLGVSTSSATAADCPTTNNSSHQCWKVLSGPNYSQVVLGRTPGGAGIACAVRVGNFADWGGILHCFSALGTSGASLTGRAGTEAQDPGWFKGSTPGMRMVSVAIEPTQSNAVAIHALRSDGLVFAAQTQWPLGPDPRIYFSPHVQSPPAGLRSITFVQGLGLVGVTTSNQVFRLWGLQWLPHGTSSVVLVAGNETTNGNSIALLGASGLSTQLVNAQAGSPPPSLPQPLTLAQSNPNNAFTLGLGRATPLAVGPTFAWALVPGNCPSGTVTPCILVSSKSGSVWGAWQNYATGDMGNPGYVMPWTIQDGSIFRGAAGEVWVISGSQHLKFWAP